MTMGADMIAAERHRQLEVEGYTLAHDKGHANDLSLAAACYALPYIVRESSTSGDSRETYLNTLWPWAWGDQDWKPSPGDRVKELTKAGALIAAAIDSILSDEDG